MWFKVLFLLVIGVWIAEGSTWRNMDHPPKHHMRPHTFEGHHSQEHPHRKHKFESHRKVERHASHASHAESLEDVSWPSFPQFTHGNRKKLETTTQDPSIPENPAGLTDPSLLIGPYEESPDLQKTEARFIGRNGSIVAAQIGTTANISCVVENRRDHETVSWIRLRDLHVITIGRQTYSRDGRFSVTYNRHSNEWVLHVRFVQERDAGQYVCQVSTHPAMVFVRTLKITEAVAMIDGAKQRIVEEGSVVKLNCTLKYHSQSPEYVFWYHNKSMINFNANRQVKVQETKDGSILSLVSVAQTDSGNYTCVPPNAKPASIALHVILDDAPAAMQVSASTSTSPFGEFLLIWLLFQSVLL